MTNELYHHGILGMKWGVRRYQNYDGSYTQAGMRRYNKSLENYEKADLRYKTAKKSNNSAEITNARLSRKKAKKELNKHYNHLRQDKLADQGKELYSKGKTITDNSKVTNLLSSVGAVALGVATANYNKGTPGYDKVNKYLMASGLLALTVAGAKGLVDHSEAKKLRAYYSHTSNY